MTSQVPVGLIGLGAMGMPIAVALRDAGRSLVVFDQSEAAVAEAASRGWTVAGGAAEVGKACPVVLLSLPGPAAVEAVVAELAATTPAPTVLDMSTIDPQTADRCREVLAGVQGDYGDCPVLGRPSAVGRWTVPVGGSADVLAAAEALLAPVANRIVPVGEVGAASTLKVLNNLMLGTINAATAEVLVVAEAAGLDPGVFVDTVINSGAASVSGLFRDIAPRAVDDDFTPTFSVALMHKDNRLALELAERLGIPLPVGTAVQTVNTMALAAGHGAEDSIGVMHVYETLTGYRPRRRTTSARDD